MGEERSEGKGEDVEGGDGAAEEVGARDGGVGAEEEEGDIVFGEILGVEGGDFLEEVGDDGGGIGDGDLLESFTEALFAEEGAAGVVGFDEGIGVAEDEVVGLEVEGELGVVGGVVDAEGDVGDAVCVGVGVLEEGPGFGLGAEEEWGGVAGVAEGEGVGGAEEGGDDGGGEGVVGGEFGEL